MSSRKSDAERKKDEDALENTREKHRLDMLREKAEAAAAKEKARWDYDNAVRKSVNEICKLEKELLCSIKESSVVLKAVGEKQFALEKDTDRLRNYYQTERENAKKKCEKTTEELKTAIKNAELKIQACREKLETAEKHAEEEHERLTKCEEAAIAKKEDEKQKLEMKIERLAEHQPLTASSKKKKIELQEKIEQFPGMVKSWVSYNAGKYPGELPSEDYKQHELYKKKQGITERALPQPEKNQLEIPKKQSETKSPEPEKFSTFSSPPLTASPPPQKNEKFPSESQKVSEPLVSNRVVRKRKTVSIAENASGSIFNGINIISSTKRPQVILTTIVPGKKWLQYSLEERNNMSHYDAWNLEQEWKEELAEERNRKDRELQAKISKEQDEAEAEGIRAMRKAEEAEKEWAALEED